jgi:hypothetical protein
MLPYTFETTVSKNYGLFINPFGLGGSFRDEFHCCVRGFRGFVDSVVTKITYDPIRVITLTLTGNLRGELIVGGCNNH